MKFMNLGRSGLSVSRLCLGTMNFGPETDEASAHAIMDAALANGINFFDASISPYSLVASTTFARRPPPLANQRPIISSVRPCCGAP